jgi:hypothetical protein
MAHKTNRGTPVCTLKILPFKDREIMTNINNSQHIKMTVFSSGEASK